MPQSLTYIPLQLSLREPQGLPDRASDANQRPNRLLGGCDPFTMLLAASHIHVPGQPVKLRYPTYRPRLRPVGTRKRVTPQLRLLRRHAWKCGFRTARGGYVGWKVSDLNLARLLEPLVSLALYTAICPPFSSASGRNFDANISVFWGCEGECSLGTPVVVRSYLALVTRHPHLPGMPSVRFPTSSGQQREHQLSYMKMRHSVTQTLFLDDAHRSPIVRHVRAINLA